MSIEVGKIIKYPDLDNYLLCFKGVVLHEVTKLKEARYFLNRMRDVVEDPESFQFELSAFLSSARSILQYGNEEAKTKSGGQAWYDSQVCGNPILRHFKDKRDINIHCEPVETNRQIEVTVTEHVHVSESLRIEILREDGSVEVREHKDSPAPIKPHSDESTIEIKYHFDDWSGQEDVIDLSESYIVALEGFISNGQTKGFLTC